MLSLAIKSAVIGSPLEPAALILRKIAKIPFRLRHPELSEMFEEDRFIDLVIRATLRPGSNCIDAGCHLGSVLSRFLKFAPFGRHLAIEPVPTKYELLRRKFPTVDLRCVALSDKAGTAMFEEDIKRPGFSRLSDSPRKNSRSYSVETVTLDSIVTHPFHFIKMDIEGGELNALRGATKILAQMPPILFECGSEHDMLAQKVDRGDIFNLLRAAGYSIRTARGHVEGCEPLTLEQFRKCGIYPFRAFNFVAS